MDEGDETLDDILGQTAWIRGLARHLVMDAAERDDVVQQVWVEALRKGRRARALRPWLFGVMRNVARKEFRRDESRRAREEASEPATATPQPDELVERVELEREVASALLEIAEPYRSTLLLRYYEDLAPTEIARRLKIPPGTVRWRLKQGLELLRANLDKRFSGDRRRWALALVPTAAAARGGLGKVAIATIGGVLIMKVSTKVVAAAVVLLLFVFGGVAFFRHAATTNEVSRAHPGVAWRVPGGIGATTTAPPTVAGVAVPPWFGQRGAPIRRIAGRVTFGGRPVANATVELASDLTDAGLMPAAKRRTGDDGRFDFGTQPPAKFSVAASAEGRGPAIIEADTRNPTVATDQLELRLSGCEASLYGHVNDASGGPVAAAQVCLAPPRASACVTADGNGAYAICLSPRQEFVTVSAPGYGALYDRYLPTGRKVRRDYSLTPEATVVGRVVRADTNAPVAGANVRVQAVDAMMQRFAAPAATTSDAQGKFTLGGLAAGRARILAFAAGLASTAPVEINIEAGKSSGEILLRLRTAARLSGVVTDGRDPIVGATVSLGGGAPGAPVPLVDAVTQADGSFVIDPAVRGRTQVVVRDYEVEEPRMVTIDREEVSGVRVHVGSLGSIAGRVQPNGKPLAGAQVTCGRMEAIYADEQGNYIVRGLTADHYRVYGGNLDSGAFGFYPDVQLGKGEHRTGVDIDVKYNGQISGVVVEPDGKPVPSVAVLYDAVKLDDHGQDVTAPDGTFHVRSLLGGDDYRPTVRLGVRDVTPLRIAGGGQNVTIKDGATEVTDVRIIVQRDHLAISGSTLDGDGQPLSDVRVDAYRTQGNDRIVFNEFLDHSSTVSAADGSFTIADLDAGSFILRARAGDGSEGVARGVAAGQKGVIIRLQRAGAIEGTLVGFTAQPEVRASRQGGFSPPSFAAVDGTSAFHLRGLSAGTYQVAAVGAESDAQMVEVASGQTATVTLKSRGSATIHGRVVDWKSGAPVAGLRCLPGMRTTPAMPMWIDTVSALSDDSGAFVLEDAPAGALAVMCIGPGPSWSDGRCELTVTPGQDATCEVPVVHINPDTPLSSVGARIPWGPMPARFDAVRLHGTADRAGVKAGDIINIVDGDSVLRLTPWTVQRLICQHPVGSTVHLGLTRGGEATTADVVMVPED